MTDDGLFQGPVPVMVCPGWPCSIVFTSACSALATLQLPPTCTKRCIRAESCVGLSAWLPVMCFRCGSLLESSGILRWSQLDWVWDTRQTLAQKRPFSLCDRLAGLNSVGDPVQRNQFFVKLHSAGSGLRGLHVGPLGFDWGFWWLCVGSTSPTQGSKWGLLLCHAASSFKLGFDFSCC